MVSRRMVAGQIPLVVDVQSLFCSDRILNQTETSINHPKQITAIKFAIRSGQTAAIAAIRTAHLIDIGEIAPCRISGAGTAATSPPLDGVPTVYTFVVPDTQCSRAARLMVVADARARMCSAFEIICTAAGTCSRWLATAINDEVFGESPSIAEAFDGCAWARDLAQLSALSKLESIPAPVDENRSRRARGLPPLPGYIKATLPSNSCANSCSLQSAHHASPKPHPGRGHSHHFSDGRIVRGRPCIIPGGPLGVGAHPHTPDGDL